MTGPYDIYPAVDADYNFPPEIRTALLAAADMVAALNAARDAAVTIVDAQGTGMVSAFAGSAAPTNWLLCDGSAVNRSDYANLFAVIGTTYGPGNGTTTFNLPNLKGRVIVGLDSAETEFATAGQTGGEKTHVLTIAELATHTHVQNAHGHSISDPGHNHSQNAHGHGISDPGHNHGTYDPGHGHGISDPGHGHGSTTLSGFQTYMTATATRTNMATGTGRYNIGSTDINAIGYGTAAGSGTGISINGNSTGVSNYGNTTGVSVQASTASNNSSGTGVGVNNTTATSQNTGSSTAHNNLQPYMAMNYIIHI